MARVYLEAEPAEFESSRGTVTGLSSNAFKITNELNVAVVIIKVIKRAINYATVYSSYFDFIRISENILFLMISQRWRVFAVH